MYYYQPILFFVFDILKTKFTNLICEAQKLGSSPIIKMGEVTYLITDHYHPNHLGLS